MNKFANINETFQARLNEHTNIVDYKLNKQLYDNLIVVKCSIIFISPIFVLSLSLSYIRVNISTNYKL